VRLLLAAVAAVLVFASAAQARVVVVATGGAGAALLDTRTNGVTRQLSLPGATRAVAAARVSPGSVN